MKCFYHTNRDAVSQCPKCNKGLCKECLNSEGNLCRDCELEEQEQLKEEAAASEKEKEVKMRKKSYYILASLVGFFIFGFIVLSPINSFDQFLQVLIFTFCFGSMPSGWRIMTRITQNKIIPDTFSDRVVVNPSAVIGFYLLKFLFGSALGFVALIYEIYEVVNYFAL